MPVMNRVISASWIRRYTDPMIDHGEKSGRAAPRRVADIQRRRRKYDWETLLDGQTHRLVAGQDFWVSVRVMQNQVAQMARSRGVTVKTWSELEEARAKQAPKRILWIQADRNAKSM